MPNDYIDIDPVAVTTAGRGTAALATDWSGWASRVESTLRTAAGQAAEAVLGAAVEEHLATWNPRLHGMAADTTALGGNAVCAATVVTNADTDSAGVLGRQAGTEHVLTTVLSRPIAW